jgi:hypothetical protein
MRSIRPSAIDGDLEDADLVAEIAGEIEADVGVEVVESLERQQPAPGVVANEEPLEVIADTVRPTKASPTETSSMTASAANRDSAPSTSKALAVEMKDSTIFCMEGLLRDRRSWCRRWFARSRFRTGRRRLEAGLDLARQNATPGLGRRHRRERVAVDRIEDGSDDLPICVVTSTAPGIGSQPLLLARPVRQQRQIALREAIAGHMHEGLDIGNARRPPDRDEVGKRDREAVDRALAEVEFLNAVGAGDKLAVYARQSFDREFSVALIADPRDRPPATCSAILILRGSFTTRETACPARLPSMATLPPPPGMSITPAALASSSSSFGQTIAVEFGGRVEIVHAIADRRFHQGIGRAQNGPAQFRRTEMPPDRSIDRGSIVETEDAVFDAEFCRKFRKGRFVAASENEGVPDAAFACSAAMRPV